MAKHAGRPRETRNERVAVVIGAEAWQLLCEKLGGRRLHVPAHAGPDHYLTQIIGQAAANKLCFEFSNDRIDLPMAEHKRALVLQALAKRLPIVDIARTYFVTERYVYKVQEQAREERAESDQLRLL